MKHDNKNLHKMTVLTLNISNNNKYWCFNALIKRQKINILIKINKPIMKFIIATYKIKWHNRLKFD